MILNSPGRQTKHYMLGKVAAASLMMTDFPRIANGPNLHNKKFIYPGIFSHRKLGDLIIPYHYLLGT